MGIGDFEFPPQERVHLHWGWGEGEGFFEICQGFQIFGARACFPLWPHSAHYKFGNPEGYDTASLQGGMAPLFWLSVDVCSLQPYQDLGGHPRNHHQPRKGGWDRKGPPPYKQGQKWSGTFFWPRQSEKEPCCMPWLALVPNSTSQSRSPPLSNQMM